MSRGVTPASEVRTSSPRHRLMCVTTGIGAQLVPLTPEELLQNVPWRAWSSGPLTCLWLGLTGLLARLIGCRRLAE